MSRDLRTETWIKWAILCKFRCYSKHFIIIWSLYWQGCLQMCTHIWPIKNFYWIIVKRLRRFYSYYVKIRNNSHESYIPKIIMIHKLKHILKTNFLRVYWPKRGLNLKLSTNPSCTSTLAQYFCSEFSGHWSKKFSPKRCIQIYILCKKTLF